MRQLTLILSDLYLPPEESHGGGAEAHPLPAFEELLRIADAPRFVGDWRAWLASRAAAGGASSVAEFCAPGVVEDARLAGIAFATPLHLEARLDHVRLADRGLLHLDREERSSLHEEFARTFGPRYALHDGGARTGFLSGLEPDAARTTDPARLLGTDIGPAVPARAASELRRLNSEIEMWLHGAAFNVARARARRPQVSALWMWRGAAVPGTPAAAFTSRVEFFGDDPVLDALNRRAGGDPRPAPAAYAACDEETHALIAFAPLTGAPGERLPALETHWFEPARAALRAGTLAELTIVANDRVFRIVPAARWRFWRRPSPWLARLGGVDAGTKA